MNYSLSSIRWLRVLTPALAVVAASFLVLMLLIAGYAFVLAFEVRGAPDQTAINHFAARISPRLLPWLEMLLTFVVSFIVARRAEAGSMVQGICIGALAGLLSLAVTLAFGGRLGLHSLVFLAALVGLAWLGGFVGQRKTGST